MPLLSIVLAVSLSAAAVPAEGVSPAKVSATVTDPGTGDVWIGTLGTGLARSSGGRVDRFTQFNSGLASDLVLDVAVWGRRVWVATASGVSGYDPRSDSWALYLERRGDVPQTLVVRLAVVPAERLIGVTSTGSLLRYDTGLDAWVAAEAALEGSLPPPEGPAAGGARAAESSRETPPTIGLLAPMSRTIALPEEAGARPPVVVDQIAVEEALARAGGAVQLSAPAFQFERYGWGTPDDTLSILAGRPEVLGIVGHIGPDEPAPAVLAERLEIPVVDAAAAGPDGGGTPNRWVFRCGRYGRDAQAALLDALLARPKLPRIAVIRTPGEESARRLDFWALRGSERGNPAVLDLEWNPGLDDPGPALSRMRRAKVEVVLTWADAQATALLLRRMREGGVRALLVGGEGIVSDDFVRLAGPEPGAVAAVAPCRHAVADDDVGTESVRDRSVLAANHLLAAIRDSAADRSAVRDSLERMRSESAATLDRGVWRRCHPSAIAPGGGRARR